MHHKIKNSLIILTLLISIVALGGSAAALINIPADYLYFELGDDAAFVPTTIDGSDTCAVIDFTMYFDEEEVPGGYMDEIQVVFRYHPDSLYFDPNEVNTFNWDGEFEVTVEDQTGTDYKVVTLAFTDPDVDHPCPTTETMYARMYLRPKCIAENSVVTLEFIDESTNNKVRIGNDNYIAGNTDDGSVTVEEYTATFWIPEVELECGPLGESVPIEVKATTNFRLGYVYHAMPYDSDKLTPDSVVLPDGVIFSFATMTTSQNNDSIYVSLVLINNAQSREFDDEVLYELYSTIEYDQGFWFGQENKATLVFDTDTSMALPSILDNGPVCVALAETGTYNPGAGDGDIWVHDYTAEMAIDFDCTNGCGGNGEFSGTKLTDTAMVRIKTNFPASMAVQAIRANLDLGPHFQAPWVIEVPDGLSFYNDYQQGDEEFQVYNDESDEEIENCNEFSDLFLIRLEYINDDESNSGLSWTDRDLTFGFEDNGTTRIVDVTGEVIFNHNDMSVLTPGSAEVTQMGEFSTTSGGSHSVFVSHELRIRNDFDLDTFSVVVTANNDWCIKCIECESNVAAVKNANDEYKIHSKSGFSRSDGGDTYETVATIWYGIFDDCAMSKHFSMTPTLSSGLMKDDNDYSQIVVYDPHGVSARCNDYQGGCSEVSSMPAPCKTAPIRKEGDGVACCDDLVPTEFKLHPNRPNPFNPTTYISYEVPHTAQVTIEIINVLGQQVAVLVDETRAPGSYEAVWHGRDDTGREVSSGIYFCRMKADTFTKTTKMMLMK